MYYDSQPTMLCVDVSCSVVDICPVIPPVPGCKCDCCVYRDVAEITSVLCTQVT